MAAKNILEFEITIGRKFNDYWPIHVRINDNGMRRDLLDLNFTLEYEQLIQKNVQNHEYGKFLGEALFNAARLQGDNKEGLKLLRDSFKEALGKSSTDCPLRILLSIDNAQDEKLTTVEWQRLCAPIDADGTWSPLALHQRVPFSMYIPTAISTKFPLLRREDLRALVLVASPDDLPDKLPHFNVKNVVSAMRQSLGDIPHKFLVNNIDHDDCIGAPTLKNLCQQLTDAKPRYNLLHIVCHGTLTKDKDTTLYWADENNKQSLVLGEELIKELKNLPVPHFAFLCTCNSAAARAEVGEAPLGGLAQRLVRELGMPAVIAMTREVTIETASKLTDRFYPRLRESGEVDIALKEATAGLGDHYDITVPVLFSRLGARPLFIGEDHFNPNLKLEDIQKGIEKLNNLFKEHSPLALKEKFEEQKPLLFDTEKKTEALKEINNLCYQVFDLTFDELATGKEPPKEQEVECPFPGLSSFGQEEFHKFFFGREALIRDLKQVFDSGENFLAVLGNSGTGKSSLVLAGLIPSLKKEQKELNVKCITPGNEPLNKLDEAISQLSGNSVILVVDQFEELFTFRSSEGVQTDEDLKKDRQTREEFIKKMLTFAQRQKVVITMRADFLGECANYNNLKTQINNKKNFVLVGPLETKELAEVIQKQANAAGLRFEAGLNTLILAEVEQEPGAMPLLQYALKLLYERRCGRWLCDEDYHNIGGVRKAIATIADNFYNSLKSEAEKEQVKNIFLRLTRLQQSLVPDDKPKYMRKRVYLKDLSPNKDDSQTVEEINKLLDRLAGAEARLLVKSGGGENQEDTVEVAHEALMNYWPTFKAWWAENQVNLQLRESIQQVLSQWQETKDESLLMRGSQLEAAQELLKQKDFLNDTEKDYVQASIEAQNCQKGKELEQVIATHTAYSQLLFVSNQRLDALAELIKAGEKLQQGIKISAAAEFSFLVTFGQMFAEIDEINSLKGHEDSVFNVAFSPDDQIIASASFDKTIKLWKRDGTLIETLSKHDNYVTDVCFSPDGTILASASLDNTIKLWQKQEILQTATNQQSTQWKLIQTLTEHKRGVFAVSFSPKDNIMASGSDDNTVILWHYKDGSYSPFITLSKHTERVLDVAFSPDGKFVASASTDKTMKIWTVEGELFSTLEGHNDTVTSVSFIADSQTLISSSEDKTIRLWGIDGRELYTQDIEDDDEVNYVACSREGKKIASAHKKGTIVIWEKDDDYLTKLRTLTGHKKTAFAVNFSSDSNTIVSCSSDNTVKLWQGSGKFEGYSYARITSISFSQDGQTIAIASEDGTIKLWDNNGQLKQTLPIYSKDIIDIKFNPAGNSIATVTDGTLKLWSLAGELLREPTIFASSNGNHVRSLSFSPDGTMMAIGSNDNAVKLWHLGDDSIEVLYHHESEVDRTTFSLNGKMIASVSQNQLIWYDLDAKTTVEGSLKTQKYRISDISFSPDSQKMASFSRDGLKIWHLQGQSLQSLDINHKNDIICIKFVDNNMLILLTDNQTLELWNLEDRQLLQSQNINKENNGYINVGSFNANGSTIAVANLEPKIKLWFLNSNELINNSRNLIVDYLRLQQ